MKKKLLLYLFAGILALATLGGCSAQPQAPSGTGSNEQLDLLDQIKEKGEIVIATEGTWAPWTYHNDADDLVGFDVEVAKRVAEKLGVTATFVEAEWDSILAGIDAGRYDIAANGVEVTDERSEKYDFTDPYAHIGTVIIVRDDDSRISAFEDLDSMKTANTLASTYASIAESYGAEPVGVSAFNESIELLTSGRVDATLNDEVTYFNYMNVHPNSNLKVAVTSDEKSNVSIPTQKGEHTDTLRTAINEALAELAQEGVLSELSMQYFGVDVTQK